MVALCQNLPVPPSAPPTSELGASAQPVTVPLSRAGMGIRLAVTTVVLALTLAGTLWGSNADFPFAPFRMFADAESLNKPVKSTRVEAVTSEGERIRVGGGSVGMRRAEFEGQVRRFRQDRSLMRYIAQAYHARNPRAPQLVQIDIIVRHFELINGKATKKYHDTIELSWHRGGA